MTPATIRVTLVAGAFAGAVAGGGQGAPAVAAVALGALGAACALLRTRRAATCAVIVLAVAGGAARGVTATVIGHGPGDVAGHLDAGATLVRGTVADAGVPGRDDTVVIDARALATASGTWPVAGRVVAQPLSPADVLPGDVVDVQTLGLRSPPRRAGSLGGSSLERVGVVAVAPAARVTTLAPGPPSVARLAEQARRALATAVTAAVPEPVAAVLLGVALGIHAGLPAAVRTPLQDAGLVHLVAVSGLKVALLAGLVAALGRSLAWPRRATVLATLATLAGYVVVSGAGAAAIRSSMVVAAGLLLARDGRRLDGFATLALCAAVMLGLEPATATDVGFQLSFLGTAGILLLAAPIAARIPGPRGVADALAVTCAAQLATLSVSGATFGVVSPVSPLANAVALPLVPVVIALGGAGAVLTALVPGIGPALGWLPLQVAALATRAILAVASGAAALPGASVAVPAWPLAWTCALAGAWVGAGVLWLLARRRSRRPALAAVAAAALVAAAAAGTAGAVASLRATGVRVTVLDVGDATAVLVRPAAGGLVLIDTGPDAATLMTALGRVLSPLDRRLDAVVLTATNHAAAGALGGLIGHDGVGSLVVSQPLPAALQAVAATMAGAGTTVLSAGDHPWSIDGATIRCLATAPGATAPCVVQVTDAGESVLVTGALSPAAQDELAGMQGERLRADLLVGPPATAPTAALLGAAGPGHVAVPGRRSPAGTSGLPVPVDVTGRDGDLGYEAGPDGLWPSPS